MQRPKFWENLYFFFLNFVFQPASHAFKGLVSAVMLVDIQSAYIFIPDR